MQSSPSSSFAFLPPAVSKDSKPTTLLVPRASASCKFQAMAEASGGRTFQAIDKKQVALESTVVPDENLNFRTCSYTF
jgi:hypothetical protein